MVSINCLFYNFMVSYMCSNFFLVYLTSQMISCPANLEPKLIQKTFRELHLDSYVEWCSSQFICWNSNHQYIRLIMYHDFVCRFGHMANKPDSLIFPASELPNKFLYLKAPNVAIIFLILCSYRSYCHNPYYLSRFLIF